MTGRGALAGTIGRTTLGAELAIAGSTLAKVLKRLQMLAARAPNEAAYGTGEAAYHLEVALGLVRETRDEIASA